MKLQYIFFNIAIVFLKLKYNSGENILFISSTPGRSHGFWDKALIKILLTRGHNITMFTHFPEKPQTNFTTIHLEGFFEKYCVKDSIEALVKFPIKKMFWGHYISCHYYLNTKGYQILLQQAKNGIKYDLIFMDVANGPCLWPIISMFGSPPTIATSAFGILPYIGRGFGITSQIAFSPFYSLPYSDEMTFYQRFINYFMHIYEIYLQNYYLNKIYELHKEYFGENVKHYSEYERNFSLLFANYNPILDFPKSIPPNVIPLGGVHFREANPLSEDLQTFMDNSTQGVIIVSFGTIALSTYFKNDLIEMFIDVFSKLNQTVVWKYESDISNLPPNVKTVAFLPQIDLLVHRNVKVFVGHGGAASTQEALYYGVPLIGMPFLLDQHSVVAKIVKRKVGLCLNYHNLSSSYILETIQEVIQNPIYKSNAKMISHRYRSFSDRPQDRLVHYTELVLRERGATWLRPSGADMSFVQLNLFDVWLAVLSALGVIIVGVIIMRMKIKLFIERSIREYNMKKDK